MILRSALRIQEDWTKLSCDPFDILMNWIHCGLRLTKGPVAGGSSLWLLLQHMWEEDPRWNHSLAWL
jgi:hypothetical protein